MRTMTILAALGGVLGTLAVLVAALVLVGPGRAFAAGQDWSRPMPLGFELLRDLPQGQRFQHISSIQVRFTDRDGHPVSIATTLGKVASASGSTLTLNTNDGSTATYALDGTTRYGGFARGSADLAANDLVAVQVRDGAAGAANVIDLGDGTQRPPFRGGWHGGWHGWGGNNTRSQGGTQ